MPNEENIIKIDHYTAIEVFESNGKFYLIGLHKGGGTQEVWYRNRCLPELRYGEFKESDKPDDIKVCIGDKTNITSVLNAIASVTKEKTVIKTGNSTAIDVSEYNGKISLIGLHNGRGDQEAWYWDRCLPEKWFAAEKKRRFKTEKEKPEPIKVFLGEKKDIIKILQAIAVKCGVSL